VCAEKCATKVKNAEPTLTLIQQELNCTQQRGKSDHCKNDDAEERFKRMSKSPHGSQKPKVFTTAVENDNGSKNGDRRLVPANLRQ